MSGSQWTKQNAEPAIDWRLLTEETRAALAVIKISGRHLADKANQGSGEIAREAMEKP